ncbi:MAG: aminopeptidase P family protein [Breznakia sp.]
MINERIKKLQNVMRDKKITMYYIPTSDFHGSEYVAEYFQVRKYMSGFSGSAGVMIITQKEAHLWSDGRYYLQAEKQTKDNVVVFHRQGEKGVVSPLAFVHKHFKENDVLAFDGRVVAAPIGNAFKKVADERNGSIRYDEDLVDAIWKDRPAISKAPVYRFDDRYAGESAINKIHSIRSAMKASGGAQAHLIASLDDIAYILNLRGDDIKCTPVFLSYLYIGEKQNYLYLDIDKVGADIKKYLDTLAIEVKAYDALYDDIKTLDVECLWLDPEHVNYMLYSNVKKEIRLMEAANPSILMKAVKNQVEIENARIAHVKDGVAITKFMYWLKQNVGKQAMDEISVADYLENLRKQQADFIELSFDTISAYKANAANAHYKAQVDSKADIKAEGTLLLDSGGQYLQGTTDITRTFALGDIDDVVKKHFTLVLESMIRLADVTFLQGVTGINLDILARAPLWQHGIDYKHGTGHGIGHFLGVHEGPQSIRWQSLTNRKEETTLVEGMMISNEPGVYIEGAYGIRIENLLVVQKAQKVGNDQFLKFETLTLAPIDLDMIDLRYLSESGRAYVNTYHKNVFEKLHPFLDENEVLWLKEYTREI